MGHRERLALTIVVLLTLVAAPARADATTLVFPLLLKSWDASPAVTPTPDPRGIVIVSLAFDQRDEVLTLRNDGLKDQDMTGWMVLSVTGNQRFRFPDGYVLVRGATVRIHSGPDAVEAPPDDLLWSASYIWNNAGDTAVLLDADEDEVDRLGY